MHGHPFLSSQCHNCEVEIDPVAFFQEKETLLNKGNPNSFRMFSKKLASSSFQKTGSDFFCYLLKQVPDFLFSYDLLII